MTTISLCMIVKDEERCLARCLNSARDHVDEIVIVDTGSTDKTKHIASAYTDKLYDFEWTGSFADARNFSIAKACKEWILVLDADEAIMETDLKRLVDILGTTRYDAFFLVQRNYTNDAAKTGWMPLADEGAEKIGYKGYIPNPVIRIFRNNKSIHFNGVVHEVVDESLDHAKCKTLDIPIQHYWEEKDIAQRQQKYLEITEQALREKPSGRLHAIAAAICYNFKQDYNKALYHFRQAAERGYKRNSMLESTAECYLRLGDYSSAYKAYRNLAQSGYRNTAVCSNLANLMVRRGEYQPALELLNFALAKTTDPGIAAKLRDHIRITKQFINKNA